MATSSWIPVPTDCGVLLRKCLEKITTPPTDTIRNMSMLSVEPGEVLLGTGLNVVFKIIFKLLQL